VLSLTSKMFNFARTSELLPEGAINPAVGIERFAEDKRARWVEPPERPRLITAIPEEPDPYIRAAMLLLLLTGARKNELLRAKWEDVVFESGEPRGGAFLLVGPRSGNIRAFPITG
jgi:integrase